MRSHSVVEKPLVIRKSFPLKLGDVIDLADNIPDFILAYLKQLNCDRLETEPNKPISSQMPLVIAW
ncbi:MAG: hypothetical protein V7K73_04160 [Nostoc sp.]